MKIPGSDPRFLRKMKPLPAKSSQKKGVRCKLELSGNEPRHGGGTDGTERKTRGRTRREPVRGPGIMVPGAAIPGSGGGGVDRRRGGALVFLQARVRGARRQ